MKKLLVFVNIIDVFYLLLDCMDGLFMDVICKMNKVENNVVMTINVLKQIKEKSINQLENNWQQYFSSPNKFRYENKK